MKRLKILVVNDDGILSPGIERLARNAARFGEVWVAAPASQCSGMSQRLSISGTLTLEEPAFPAPVNGAYAIGGTPADCVKVALKSLLPVKPDFVFSGINFGYNTGYDIAYSGTVGAAMEAVMNGIPAIAFSTQHDGSYDVTDKYIEQITEELISAPPAPGEIWNVNFPGCPLEEFKGILRDRTPAPMCVFENYYSKSVQTDGPALLTPYAVQLRDGDAPEGTDIHAVVNGWISVGKVKSMVVNP